MNRRDNSTTTPNDPQPEPRAGEGTRRKLRRRRRPTRIIGLGARIALLSAALIALVVVAFAIVAKAVRPYVEAHDLNAQLTVLNRQIAQTDEQNAAYQRRIAYLQTPEGEMAEARNLGYLVKGEHPVVIDGTPGALNEAPMAPVTPSSPNLMGRLRGFWRSLVSGH
jgi:cell division protein FtsL